MSTRLDQIGTWTKPLLDPDGPMNRRNFLTKAKEWLEIFTKFYFSNVSAQTAQRKI